MSEEPHRWIFGVLLRMYRHCYTVVRIVLVNHIRSHLYQEVSMARVKRLRRRLCVRFAARANTSAGRCRHLECSSSIRLPAIATLGSTNHKKCQKAIFYYNLEGSIEMARTKKQRGPLPNFEIWLPKFQQPICFGFQLLCPR